MNRRQLLLLKELIHKAGLSQGAVMALARAAAQDDRLVGLAGLTYAQGELLLRDLEYIAYNSRVPVGSAP